MVLEPESLNGHVPAPPNYPLRDPKYHLIETIRPLIEVLWGVQVYGLFGPAMWEGPEALLKGKEGRVASLKGGI